MILQHEAKQTDTDVVASKVVVKVIKKLSKFSSGGLVFSHSYNTCLCTSSFVPPYGVSKKGDVSCSWSKECV